MEDIASVYILLLWFIHMKLGQIVYSLGVTVSGLIREKQNFMYLKRIYIIKYKLFRLFAVFCFGLKLLKSFGERLRNCCFRSQCVMLST